MGARTPHPLSSVGGESCGRRRGRAGRYPARPVRVEEISCRRELVEQRVDLAKMWRSERAPGQSALALPNVPVTAHVGGDTDEARRGVSARHLPQVVTLLEGAGRYFVRGRRAGERCR